MGSPTEATKALWARCPACGHCWPAAYYPLDMGALARVLKAICCPKGCESEPVLAKQRDGKLLEKARG